MKISINIKKNYLLFLITSLILSSIATYLIKADFAVREKKNCSSNLVIHYSFLDNQAPKAMNKNIVSSVFFNEIINSIKSYSSVEYYDQLLLLDINKFSSNRPDCESIYEKIIIEEEKMNKLIKQNLIKLSIYLESNNLKKEGKYNYSEEYLLYQIKNNSFRIWFEIVNEKTSNFIWILVFFLSFFLVLGLIIILISIKIKFI